MQVTNTPVDAQNREATRHGNAAFPLAVYNSVMSKNVLGYTKLHWHDEIQFCLVTQGAIDFSVNEQKFHLPTGDGIFINSGYLHMARPAGDPHSAYICLDAGPQLLGSFPGSVIEKQFLLPFLTDTALGFADLRQAVPWQRQILGQVQAIYRWHEEKTFGYELAIEAHLLLIFFALLRHRPEGVRPQRKTRANAVVQHILGYIGQHYAENITLKEIASHAAYAPSECCRIFRKFTGESIFSYLREFRLEQSTYLLTESDHSVSDIAYSCGFSSTSYYIEAFRKQFGTTPLRYRRQATA